MALNAQKKGAAGEREFTAWLDTHLKIKTQRILGQAREGGADVETDDFLFEVKRRETLNLKSWWLQVKVAAANHPNTDIIPIVCYRQNHKQWQFLLPASFIGLNSGYVHLDAPTFKKWAKGIVDGRSENKPS